MGRHYPANEWKEFVLEGMIEYEIESVEMGEGGYEVPEGMNREVADYLHSEIDVFDDRINWSEINTEADKFEDALIKVVSDFLDKNPEALNEEYSEDDLTDDSALADVYFTLSGAGVGIWDGRRNHFFTNEKYLKELESDIEKKMGSFVDDTGAGSLNEAMMNAVYNYLHELIDEYV